MQATMVDSEARGGKLLGYILICSSFAVLLLANFCSARPIQESNKHFSIDNYFPLDDTQSFLQAWEDACGSYGSPTVSIPEGRTVSLSPVTLSGPCKASNIEIQVKGTIVAPNVRDGWGGMSPLIKIKNVNGLNINGGGTIHGRGSPWWSCRKKSKGGCSGAPRILVIDDCNQMTITNLNLMNSPNMHISISGSNDVHLSHLSITAPPDSPNTDGIDIGTSRGVEIVDCQIGTGDDCIAIKQETFDVNITQVTCGPGHGISIGGISEGNVSDVTVSNCTIQHALNGARIKTWQGGSGYVKNIKYEHIKMEAVEHPIIIDQFYCNGKHDCSNQTSAVQVSDISFIDIHGSSSQKVAIQLECSDNVPCMDIIMDNVQITALKHKKEVSSNCLNAHGISENLVSPSVSCLSTEL